MTLLPSIYSLCQHKHNIPFKNFDDRYSSSERRRQKRQPDVCPRRLVAAANTKLFGTATATATAASSIQHPASSIPGQTDGPMSLSGQQNASNTFGARKMCLPSRSGVATAVSFGQVFASRGKSAWLNA